MTAVNNNLSMLNQVLFDQLHRLNDMNLKGDSMAEERKRAYSIVKVSSEVISNARLRLEAASFKAFGETVTCTTASM